MSIEGPDMDEVTIERDRDTVRRDEIARYEEFLRRYVVDLEKIKEGVTGFDKRRIDALIAAAQDTSAKLDEKFNFSEGYVDVVMGALDASARRLSSSFEKKNNTLRSVKAFRRSRVSPNMYEQDHTGNINQDYLDHVRSVDSSSVSFAKAGSNNVVGRQSGRVLPGAVEAFQNFDGDPVFHRPGYTNRKSLEYATRSATANVDRELATIDKLLDLDRASTLTEDEKRSYDVKTSNTNTEAFFGTAFDSLLGAAGKYGRRLAGEMEAGDSSKYQKFIRDKDEALRRLVRQIGVGGIASDIMSLLERQIDQVGYLDSQTFNHIMSMIAEQKEKDGEGISQEIIDEFNKLNDKAVRKAEEHVDNEESMSLIRLFQVVLVASVIFGFPFLAPLIGEFTGAVLGQGLAQGAPELMTSEYLWVIGDFADVIMLDEFATLILTETPVVADVIGVIDYLLLSGPGLILGDSAASFLSYPIVPVGAAVAFGIYAHSFQNYNSKKDEVDKAFKGYSKQLDHLVEKFSVGPDADRHKNAGGDLVNDAKRQEFCQKKYDLLKGANKIESITNFLRFVDDLYQSDDLGGLVEDLINQGLYSNELLDFLNENGLQKGKGRVSDWDRIREAIASLIYDSNEDKNSQSLVGELFEKFGLFALACENSFSDDRSEIIQRLSGYIGDKEKVSANARLGNSIFDARYDLLRARKVAVEFDEGLLKTGIVGKDEVEVRDFVQRISTEAQKARVGVIAKESDLIKQSIEKRAVDTDLTKDYHDKVPGTSPCGVEAGRVGGADRIAGRAGMVKV